MLVSRFAFALLFHKAEGNQTVPRLLRNSGQGWYPIQGGRAQLFLGFELDARLTTISPSPSAIPTVS